jgi:hypothetical protein
MMIMNQNLFHLNEQMIITNQKIFINFYFKSFGILTRLNIIGFSVFCCIFVFSDCKHSHKSTELTRISKSK